MALLNGRHRQHTSAPEIAAYWTCCREALPRTALESWMWNIPRRIWCLYQQSQNFAFPICMVAWRKPIVCLELLYRDISFLVCHWLYDKLWNKHVQLLCMNILIAIIIETIAIILLYGWFKAFQNILLMLQQRITLKTFATSASYNSLVHNLTIVYVLCLVGKCSSCSGHCKGSSMMHISRLCDTDFGASVLPLFSLVFEWPLFKCDDNQPAYI